MAADQRSDTRREPWQDDFKLEKNLKTNAGAFNEGLSIIKRRRDGLLCIKKKIISIRGHAFEDDAARESHVVKALTGHPNINDHIATFIEKGPGPDRTTTYLILRYCDQGSLADLIDTGIQRRKWGQNIKKPPDDPPWFLPEEFIWHVFRSCAKALAWLHDGVDKTRPEHSKPVKNCNYVIHRDIKPDNILLCTDRDHAYPRVLLGDFGGSMERDELMRRHREDRTVNVSTFFPPEHPVFGRAGDIWGVGCTVLETASLKDGMKSARLWNNYARVWEFKGKDTCKQPAPEWLDSFRYYSPQLRDCIRLCLAEDPDKRPSMLYLNDEVKRGFQKLLADGRITPDPAPLSSSILPDPKDYECAAPGTMRPSLYKDKPGSSSAKPMNRAKKPIIERDPDAGRVSRDVSFVGQSESRRLRNSR